MTNNNKKRAGEDIFAEIASRQKSVKQSQRWSFPHVSIQ
jgi:hypothetical protein